ncbi:MAG: hypothetical protein AAF203_04040, partial [Pseudomonadota bacterium]
MKTLHFAISFSVAVFFFIINYQSMRISPDSGHYIRMAFQSSQWGFLRLSEGHWPPLFPWLISWIYQISPLSFIESGNIMVSLTCGLLVWFLNSQFFFGTKVDNYQSIYLLPMSITVFLIYGFLKSTLGIQLMSEIVYMAMTYGGLFYLKKFRKN